MEMLRMLRAMLLLQAIAAACCLVVQPARAGGVICATSPTHWNPMQARSTPRLSIAETSMQLRPDLEEALKEAENCPEVDMEAMFKASTFPIPPEKLVKLAKAYVATQGKVDWLAEDFRFVAPVVGPLGKQEFSDALAGFNILAAFPDLNSNNHDFRVCPFEPNRVWYSVKTEGTHTGPLLGRDPTYIKTHSVTFNEKGEITKLTIGYVMDREMGNTGGLGGIFGLLYAVGLGLPFREGQPWKKSFRYRLLGWVAELQKKIKKTTYKTKDSLNFVSRFAKSKK